MSTIVALFLDLNPARGQKRGRLAIQTTKRSREWITLYDGQVGFPVDYLNCAIIPHAHRLHLKKVE